MRHLIDPMVDFVFKLILGTPGNENLLIDFINGIVNPPSLIVSVTFINPFNEKQHEEDKYSVVDIKATDQNGVKYQIEVQLTEPSFLCDRMLYTWSSIYHTQADKGKQFDVLKPVISIWLLSGSMFKGDDKYHHEFGLFDKDSHLCLSQHCQIHVLELEKWRKPDRLQPQDYWLYFFKEAKHWRNLPDNLKVLAVMRQAMSTLESIAESEDEYLAYMSRLDRIMLKNTHEALEKESKEQLKKSEEQLKKSEEQLKKSEEQLKETSDQLKDTNDQLKDRNAQLETAQTEKAQLLELLKQAGIDTKI